MMVVDGRLFHNNYAILRRILEIYDPMSIVPEYYY